jgi:O-antigen/teichoic acid export membrane protein
MKAPHLTPVLVIAGISLFFNALNGLQLGTLTGLEAFREIFYISFVKAICTLFVVIFCTWQWGLSGMFVGLGIVAIIICIFTALIERKVLRRHEINIIYNNILCEVGILWKFTAPGVISILIPGITFWIVRTMLVQYPNGYSQLGIFTAADQWTLALSFIASSLNSAGLPILSNVYGQGDWMKYKKALLGNLALPVAITILFATAISVISPWLERLYGSSFSGMSTILVLISIISVMRVLGGTIGSFIVSIGEMWWGLLFNLTWGTILVFVTGKFLNRGAFGLALAYLVAYALQTLWSGGFLFAKLRSVRINWSES